VLHTATLQSTPFFGGLVKLFIVSGGISRADKRLGRRDLAAHRGSFGAAWTLAGWFREIPKLAQDGCRKTALPGNANGVLVFVANAGVAQMPVPN